MFGKGNMGNERSSPGSSRKAKKSNPEKPKQPQRGLGVAQLERLRIEMNYGYLPSPHAPFPSPLNQEAMRMQAAAYAPLMQSSSTSFMPSPSQSSSSYHGYHPNAMMGFGDMERGNFGYGESQTRWNPNNVVLHGHQYAQSTMNTSPLLSHFEDSMQNRRRIDSSEKTGSSSQNSETSETQDLDLELRL
ncbi:hypothetical protein Nepgr_005157 [Nepenthes gracilis]|uniref:Uncharacterized protein n=1 Tax=Nepenthes gracilis TaxID=150966 RepID=A0AAD3S2N4_NEPGR|nr:hypothetical protein Nepgr_005157 [Nepenthes gracilis]